MNNSEGNDIVTSARRRFFMQGTLADGGISQPILHSWQRCVVQGLQVDHKPDRGPVSSRNLKELQERHEKLRRLARPEIEMLQSEARRTRSAVILTDAQGDILDMMGNNEFAGRASRFALCPGTRWNEENMGTNAIGTALTERKAVVVHGAEHFFDQHRLLTCSAAPIEDPFGRLAGVLDMSGRAEVQPVYALGLVKMAVEQIEHRFFDQDFGNCQILRFHQEVEMLGTPREGILVFQDGALKAANRHGLRLVGQDWQALGHTKLSDVFPRLIPSSLVQKIRRRDGDVFLGVLTDPRAIPKRVMGVPPGQMVTSPVPRPILIPSVKADLARAVRLLSSDIPVLIHGETGVGKEVFAQLTHARSARSGKAFVAVNCAALPESLIEAELFGYEAGAFTGARKQGQEGMLRQAHGGVLFLDEIGDMPLALQARLLRVLQDKQIRPLGGRHPVAADFSLICATHQPLADLVQSGVFRQDLYFRVAHYTIALPPLRQYPDRLSVIRTIWAQIGGDAMPLDCEAEKMLAQYDWPGNFRQLTSVLRALAVLGEPGLPITADVLPADIRLCGAANGNNDQTLGSATQDILQKTLEEVGGNVSMAARKLGIDRSTIYRRMRKSGEKIS